MRNIFHCVTRVEFICHLEIWERIRAVRIRTELLHTNNPPSVLTEGKHYNAMSGNALTSTI